MNINYIMAACSLILLSLPASAEVYKCKNETGGIEYKDRPCDSQTQKEVSLGKPKNATKPKSDNTPKVSKQSGNAQKMYIEYLDNLKICRPYTVTLDSFGELTYTIIGKNEGRCHITMQGDLINGEVTCNFSDKTIALFTSDEKYQDIRNGVSPSTGNQEAERMSAECEYPY